MRGLYNSIEPEMSAYLQLQKDSQMPNFYYIACQIERGAFTNERTFEIELSDNITHQGERNGIMVGTAHASHLRTSQRQGLGEDEPSYGQTIDGFVQCRIIRELPSGWVLVEVPSADVIHVSKDSLVSAG
jgi:hypothetical protein